MNKLCEGKDGIIIFVHVFVSEKLKYLYINTYIHKALE